MNSKVFTIRCIILLSLLIIPNHGLDCNCYTISEPVVESVGNVGCFSYTIDTSSCTPTGQLWIYLGIDTDDCYMDAYTLEMIHNYSDPGALILNSDEPGYEFEITQTIMDIELCLYGITSIGNGIINIEDNDGDCKSQTDILPDFCGACDGNYDLDVCCSFTSDADCTDGNRPNGNTECIWDDTIDQCILSDLNECDGSQNSPCICFIDQRTCSTMNIEGDLPCLWDNIRDECVKEECIDTRSCDCYETRQDCINLDQGEPWACIWDEQCIDFDTTEQPTIQPTEPGDTIDPSPEPTPQPTTTTTYTPTTTRSPSYTPQPSWSKSSSESWSKPSSESWSKSSSKSSSGSWSKSSSKSWGGKGKKGKKGGKKGWP